MSDEIKNLPAVPDGSQEIGQPTPPDFVIGGVNSTETIRNLREINGVPIEKLEEIMRGDQTVEDEDFPDPNWRGDGLMGYYGIFLGFRESLIDILAEDNDTVLRMGITHQQLGDFLNTLARSPHDPDAPEYVAGKSKGTPWGTFTINDRKYYVEVDGHIDGEGSPFRDGDSGSIDFHVTNVASGSNIVFGSMQGEMIRKYGFYEGRGTKYRLDPKNLAEFAGFVPGAIKMT